MPNQKFVQGVRDVIRYFDYKVEGAVELKSIFDVLTSDEETDKVAMQDGSKDNILPTKNFKITVDPSQLAGTGIVTPSNAGNIAPAVEWTYNKDYVTKAELAMFDILAHNNWKRPIYFAVTVPADNYIGLQKYLYNEGFAYRLMPLKPADSVDRDNDVLNTQAMYNNLMNKFQWNNLRDAPYLDPESTRMIAIVMKSFNQLAEKLISEGKKAEAHKVMLKALEVVPEKNHMFYFILHRYYTADLLYQVNETQKANKLVEKTAEYILAELNYLLALSNQAQSNDLQLGASVFNELIKVTETHKQTALNAKLKNQFKALESRLNMGMGMQ
jgi:hypothetical protein